MTEISRLSGRRGWIDLDFVERKRAPDLRWRWVCRRILAGSSLSNTLDLLAAVGVQRNRKGINNFREAPDIHLKSSIRARDNDWALIDTVDTLALLRSAHPGRVRLTELL